MIMRELKVYNNDVFAGELTESNPGIGYTFKYDDGYLKSDMPSISVTLPKRTEIYTADLLFPFFANMIPEGANRKIICRKLRIDERDIFGILYAMADKDFIGAVNVRRKKHE